MRVRCTRCRCPNCETTAGAGFAVIVSFVMVVSLFLWVGREIHVLDARLDEAGIGEYQEPE